jgi:hypothetical protein
MADPGDDAIVQNGLSRTEPFQNSPPELIVTAEVAEIAESEKSDQALSLRTQRSLRQKVRVPCDAGSQPLPG